MTEGILLDTCAWIWLVDGHPRISKSKYLPLLEKSASKHELYLCPISMWELSMKAAKGKIQLSIPVLDWILQSKIKSRISDTVITAKIAYDSTILPNDFHGDPADRLIVATSRNMQVTLITGDEKIISWKKKLSLKVYSI